MKLQSEIKIALTDSHDIQFIFTQLEHHSGEDSQWLEYVTLGWQPDTMEMFGVYVWSVTDRNITWEYST